VSVGATGNISVSTPEGKASLSGFNFVPLPAIIAGGLTTFASGESVSLTVSLPSGYAYQWIKDGKDIAGATSTSFVASKGGSYTVKVTLNTISQTSIATVVTAVSPSSPQNLTVEASSVTCKGANNGAISIKAISKLNYTATIKKGSTTATHNFTQDLKVGQLLSGTYQVCVTPTGQQTLERCFTVNLTEPTDLSVYIIGVKNNTLSLSLDGASTYYIELNGKSYSSTSNQISLPLENGNNNLTVMSDLVCQGTVKKTIVMSNFAVYPNPFESAVNLDIGGATVSSADVKVFSLAGKLVYTSVFTNVSDRIQVDLSHLGHGLYLLKLSIGNTENIIKILRK
jgi:hypothetical protein